MKHRWLVYSAVAISLSTWNVTHDIGWMRLHTIVFAMGIVCFYVWILKMMERK